MIFNNPYLSVRPMTPPGWSDLPDKDLESNEGEVCTYKVREMPSIWSLVIIQHAKVTE
jgi:hypothetical protein